MMGWMMVRVAFSEYEPEHQKEKKKVDSGAIRTIDHLS
jgi:hypothetical protein